MDAALYLIPVTLGDTEIDRVLPPYNREIILGIRHFIVEDIRSARRFLRATDKSVDIDSLTVYELNEHTELSAISDYLDPLEKKRTSHGRDFGGGMSCCGRPGSGCG